MNSIFGCNDKYMKSASLGSLMLILQEKSCIRTSKYRQTSTETFTHKNTLTHVCVKIKNNTFFIAIIELSLDCSC